MASWFPGSNRAEFSSRSFTLSPAPFRTPPHFLPPVYLKRHRIIGLPEAVLQRPESCLIPAHKKPKGIHHWQRPLGRPTLKTFMFIRPFQEAPMRAYQYAIATVTLMFSVSSASQAAATDIACTGCVGSEDLANGGVTSAKIMNGTIIAADLAPALLARIAALEAKVKKLEGGTYSQATLTGTYKCLELSVGGSWNTEKTGGGVVYGAAHAYFTADGAGTVSVTSGGDEAELTINESSAGLAINNPHHLWNEGGNLPYTVTAAGKVVVNLATPNESLTGWLSRNGDMTILQYIDNDATDRDTFRTLSTCVRTSP